MHPGLPIPVLLLVALAASACVAPYPVSPRTATFAQEDYEEYEAPGTATLSGTLRAKLRPGDPRLSPEHLVLLIPSTPYTAEHIEEEYLGLKALWPPLDHRTHHYMRTRFADREGLFSFEDLNAGEYSVGCFLEFRDPRPDLRSEIYGKLDGRWVFTPITLAEGQHLQIVLNEACLPEVQVAQAHPEPEVQEPPQETPAKQEPPPSPPKPALTLAAKALFDSGQAEVKPEGRELLRQVAETLKTVSDQEIRIEGHTDNVPIKGRLRTKFPSNLELSTARALNIMRYLIEVGGVPAERMTAVGYADTRPVATNDTPEGRQENRRIEIILLPKPSQPTPGAGQSGPSS